MNYETAKAIAEEKGLIVGPDIGKPHIDVRKSDKPGADHFSVMLPSPTETMPMTDAEQRKLLSDSLDTAVKSLSV